MSGPKRPSPAHAALDRGGSATTPRSLIRHRPELDGLRGIAILVVLAAHTRVPGFAADGGHAGVTLFFVLSGFLITSLLTAELASVGQISLPRFYGRRALRLFPALAAVLLVVAVGSLLNVWPAAGGNMLVAFPAVLLYIGDFVSETGRLGVLSHTWSLAVEEQFYLIWPIALILALRVSTPRKLGLGLVVVALLVTPWRELFVLTGDLGHAQWWPDVRADALLLGCAVALLRVRVSTLAGWAGLAGVIVTAMVWPGGTSIGYMLPIATACSVLALAGCPQALDWRPLAYLGRISYGVYLWHYLFIWWGLPWPVVIALSLLVASASYALIERPFLRLKDRLRAPETPPEPTIAGLVSA
jgi:peptidoglycan/LPS O-acetylase OafA/YrhL